MNQVPAASNCWTEQHIYLFNHNFFDYTGKIMNRCTDLLFTSLLLWKKEYLYKYI